MEKGLIKDRIKKDQMRIKEQGHIKDQLRVGLMNKEQGWNTE